MGKTLVIAEKPSVGRDIAAALPGAFAKQDEYLESDEYVITWAAGREGELISAYIYESPGAKKPVDRLWISSMTKQAIREGFERLRPGEQLRPLEQAARSRSEADWLVGMNATRAATIRGRAWVGGVVSLGRVQ